MRNLRAHDTPGLDTDGFLDRNRKRKLLHLTDPLLDIRTLKAHIRPCKRRIDLFLYILRLVDQLHQFLEKDIPLLIHQVIPLMGKRKRILGKHQISLGRKFSRIHIQTSSSILIPICMEYQNVLKTSFPLQDIISAAYPLPSDSTYRSASCQSCQALPSADIQADATPDPAYPG